ncbi:MAG TPA: RidA family protein [candidate division Zixibacteria bacterium]|nr:RidA family protein [candidate division Zixibacteria bacterium]
MRYRPVVLAAALSGGLFPVASAVGQPSVPAGESPEVRIVKERDSTVIVLAGVGPVDKQGRLAAPGDFAGQFKQAWENVRLLAAGAGSPLRNIVSVTVYLARPELREEFDRLQEETFQGWRPVTTFAVAGALRVPGALLEIHAVAVVNQPRRR